MWIHSFSNYISSHISSIKTKQIKHVDILYEVIKQHFLLEEEWKLNVLCLYHVNTIKLGDYLLKSSDHKGF